MLLLGGCAVGDDPEPTVDERPEELAATPAPLESAPPTASPADPSVPESTGGPAATTVARAERPTVGFETIGSVDDRERDSGATAPRYADLQKVILSSDGTDVRVRVEVGSSLPKRLKEGEVIGLGVELASSEGSTQEFQLFADGGTRGWLAYLHTPNGFVRYPGIFSVEGDTVTFQVPWRSLGDLHEGVVGSFLDWSGKIALVNDASEDYAPDEGTEPYG